IPACYEGLEGLTVNISGGTLTLRSDDDGINAAATNTDGPKGPLINPGLQVSISGGLIYVSADGDGIDSNGSVTMSGGELYISGSLSSSYGALDYDSSFAMSGGVLAAAGATGMAQTPGLNSTQPSVIVYFSQAQTAGKTYWLTNASGTVLLSVTPDKDFQCIVLSVPELSAGSGYALYESSGGTMANATLLYDFTISGIITSVGGTDQTRQDSWAQPPQQRRP
ncbi:MAG: carbohydrate-binding domain-containing protein, partial [Firmicutes bacterium]|nr:carbohydrate-binding domain-containing protein [Bacillota bacterium]